MARRRTNAPELSLFPFLSVLAAVMGTLILVIAGMSRIAIASPKQRIDIEAFDPGKKSAVYVECGAESIVIYPDDPTRGQPSIVSLHELDDPESAWQGLVRRLTFASARYVLLLVRPNGVRSFRAARASLANTGVDVGYEPLFGSGDLQFRQRRR